MEINNDNEDRNKNFHLYIPESSHRRSDSYTTFNYFYTNYPQQEGYTFPGSYGYYYVLGIDGNRTILRHDGVTKPTSILGSMCCPCFTANDPWSIESRKRYWNAVLSLTSLMSLLQISLFVVCIALGGFAFVSENPTIGPTAATLIEFGAKDAYLMKYKLQLWRFVSSIFLHTGIVHLALNLFAQLRLGMYFEKEWKWWRYLFVYIICGMGSNLMSCIIQPHTVSVASTGAFLGVMSAYFSQVAISWRTFDKFQRNLQLTQLLIFFALLAGLSFSPYVDLSGHLGGVITGLLLGWAIWDQEIRPYTWIIPTVLLFVYFAGGLALFFTWIHIPDVQI